MATVTVLGQNFAWAVCSNGQNLPSGGFVVGRDAIVATAANWSPNIFTAAAGSVFVPDTSLNERNDPAQPATGGGHNWVFDQGSTLCKQTDTGVDRATGRSASWNIPRTRRPTVSFCRSSKAVASSVPAIFPTSGKP